MIVIYTADVEYAENGFSAGCLTLKLEQAYLSKIDSASVRKRIQEKIKNGAELSEEERMELIVLTLTYKGREEKKHATIFIYCAVCISDTCRQRKNRRSNLSPAGKYRDMSFHLRKCTYIGSLKYCTL